MPEDRVEILALADHSDERGASHAANDAIAGFLTKLADAHIATILPGSTRGAHYHERKREILMVEAPGPWTLEWDDGDGTPRSERTFTEPGGVLIKVPPGCWHLLRNDGDSPVAMVALTDELYDPADPDTYRREPPP